MGAKLDTIARSCGRKNVKGLESYIMVANAGDVDVIPDATDKVISTDITLVATPVKGFHQWDTSFILSKNTYKCAQEGDENVSYKTTVQVFIPGITPEKTTILEDMAGCGAIVGTEDKAENVRLLGDKKTPAMIKFVEDNNGEINGYTVDIEWESGYAPYFYEGTFPTV